MSKPIDDDKRSGSERVQTDQSLRTEREKTDHALAGRQAAVEDDADETVRKARQASDSALDAARSKADHRLAVGAAHTSEAVIEKERRQEDEALQAERATEDAMREREREENTRALMKLLPLEREKTDRFLLIERGRADKAVAVRDDFLGIVSHDLRNLLGGIIMGVSVLTEKAKGAGCGDDMTAISDRIERYAARMNRLIGDLVDITSIDAGRLKMETAVGDVRPLLTEAVDLFQAAAADKHVALRLSAMEEPLLAAVDQGRVLQLLANLITNAIKFTPAGGEITVAAIREGDGVHCSVSDTGAGIPEGMLEVVFERFWQVGKNDRRGMGLGLYISRCIVEALGGSIWAESREGEGTTMHVTLPAAPRPSAEA